MNNDQEAPGEGEELGETGAQEARDAEAARRAGKAGGVSSDAGWRDVLSGLGVDVEHDKPWQSGERGSEHSDSRKLGREGRAEERPEDRPEKPRSARQRHGGRDEMEEKSQWLGESEVSIERLYELFDGAYMECDLDEDGDLRVVTDSGPRIFLSMHEPNKLIRYMAFYKFREEALEYDKLQFVNALNDDIVFIRFSLNGTDTLIADYYLPYARGASPFHIINAAKLMGRVITSGIRQHDTNNLLE